MDNKTNFETGLEKNFKGILTHTPDREKKIRFKKKIFKGILIVAAIIGIVSIPRFFSTKAQVERNFKKCIKSLEAMDVPAVMDFISNDFTNPLFTQKSTLEYMVKEVFKQFKSVNVHIIKMEVEVGDKEHAVVTVEGSIYFKDQKDQLYRAKSEFPVKVKMVREDKKWRIVSADGMNLDIISAAQDELM